MPSIFSLSLRAEGQWANHPLLAFERYSVGNYTVGRGYDPGAVTRTARSRSGRRFAPTCCKSPRRRLQLFGFYDNVVGVRISIASAPTMDADVASWGGGARAVISPYFLVEATYAKPLDRPFISGPKPPARLLLSLTSVFSPMR